MVVTRTPEGYLEIGEPPNVSGLGRIWFSDAAGNPIGDSAFVYDIATGSLGLGTVAPDASARLDIVSTTRGFLEPRMTTVQRDAIAAPATGLQVFNTDTNVLDFFNGSVWGPVGGGLTTASSAVSTTTAALGAVDVYRMLSPDTTLTISTADITEGRMFTIRALSTSVGSPVTIVAQGGQTIDGGASALLTVAGQSISLQATGGVLESIDPAGNVGNRTARLKDPADSKDVFSADDLPDAITAPDGLSRVPLVLGVKYTIHSTFVWPRLLWPSTPDTAVVFTEIFGASQNVVMLVAGDSDAHIWGRGTGNVRLNNILALDVSNGGAGFGSTFFDLVGQSTDIDPIQRQNALFIVDTGLAFFEDLGRVVDIGVAVNGSGWAAERGLVARSVNGNIRQLVTNFSHISVGAPMETPMLCYQGAQTVASLSAGASALAAGDSSFCIDSAATGTYAFIGITYGGSAFGNFFRPNISNAITAFANADIAFTSVSNSAVAPGVDSTINFGSIQKFVLGQTVLIDGADATYDGTHEIVRVSADQMSFDINVIFVATDTGDVKITRVTSAGNGLVGGETQTISGTVTYNQESEVLFRVDDDNFDIPIAFVADDAAGTVVSTGKNETTVGVDVSNCGQQPDSKSIGSMHVNSNVAVTTISTILVWVDANFSAIALPSSNIERFTLMNTTTGELRYDGNRPFSGVGVASISGTGQAGQDDYEFRFVVNGVPTSDAIVAGTSTNTNGRNIGLVAPLTLTNGDLVRLQIRNIAGTDDFTLRDVSVNIQ